MSVISPDLISGTSQKSTNRNYGIDLLRIISMLMVCTLHILGYDNVLIHTVPLTLHHNIAWFIETACYGAVNCYAMISGYVGIHSKHKYANLAYLWLQVVLYSVGITLLFYILTDYPIGIKTFIKSLLPVYFSQYWYFSAYFFLFLFLPYFHQALLTITKRSFQHLLILFLIIAASQCLYPTVQFGFNGGYSALWLVVCYFLGAYVKLYNPLRQIRTVLLPVFSLILISISWLSKLVIDIVTPLVFGSIKCDTLLISYLSPTIVLSSIFLLEFFSRLHFKHMRKIISFFSQASFGVYLIHEHPIFRDKFIKGKFTWIAEQNIPHMIVSVAVVVIVIYCICTGIDLLRICLFNVLKIKSRLHHAEEKIKQWFADKL